MYVTVFEEFFPKPLNHAYSTDIYTAIAYETNRGWSNYPCQYCVHVRIKCTDPSLSLTTAEVPTFVRSLHSIYNNIRTVHSQWLPWVFVVFFFSSSWLTNVDGMKDLWCSS